ncbi:MAG: amidohydrolase [Lewinellaceae bacterium]|nr:amidohydrolase [Lewinellaceae bacterium]
MPVNYEQLQQFRRRLHEYPEVSGDEKATAEKVLAFLLPYAPDEILTAVGGHGIIATWDSGKPGPDILFRAELDALPIQEINGFAYASSRPGVSHKCGHDGHTTILCGLAQHLFAQKPASGRVRLLFQPAEENGEGAKAMLADVRFSPIKPDYVFALHNLPGYPLGQIVARNNTFTAAVNSIIIHLNGKTSHAAEPEHGINPALAVAEILQESLAQADNHPEKAGMRVVTPVCVELGEKAYGISAGAAAVHLTIRCWDDDNLKQLETDIVSLSRKIAEKHQLDIRFEYTQTFHANMNDTTAANMVRAGAKAKGLPLIERPYPFKWGEDFGLFTAHFRGCMFGIGAGEACPALHNPDYDFPDALIETGVTIYTGIMEAIQQENSIHV